MVSTTIDAGMTRKKLIISLYVIEYSKHFLGLAPILLEALGIIAPDREPGSDPTADPEAEATLESVQELGVALGDIGIVEVGAGRGAIEGNQGKVRL